ncbi:MAG TPA: MFS transporter [Pyrinomonadaceae bacterium]|nr:MFS transporter [Pyrinomonadaceae bacterium]
MKRLLVLLHAGFFLVGIITVLLGQILPVLTKRLTLDDREAGYLFVAQFAGSLLGTLFYNRIIEKFGYLKLLFGGFCLMALGCAGLNFNSLFATSAAIFIYGGGIGSTIPAINLLIIELNHQKPASALSIINFFWGAGAILCKPFVDFVGSRGNIFPPTVLLCFFLFAASTAFAISDFQKIFKINHKNENTSDIDAVPIWTTTTAWLIAAFSFIHVGIESSIGGWITTYESRLIHDTNDGWLSAALVFFLFLLIGRGIAPVFFRLSSENTVLLCGLFIMTTGIILVLAAKNFTLLIVGTALLGFGTSSIFPTNMSRFTKIFGADSIKNATPLFIFGSLGGAFATWFVGFISTVYNNLRTGFTIILISCLMLVALQILLTGNKFQRVRAAKY